ncbi:hypothetical protein [Bosea rubneri]|uniref:DUF669 domain-containing protein n=1 Tax=Bosea rubneri TaxID=3075434 RepID=A0ABU3SG03_9HYPH|nr:hypothetical protein [Bosea sp. ZW T0_25]MDU0343712.1 hypothetical protein [Bosea sp. ZW T0_25]
MTAIAYSYNPDAVPSSGYQPMPAGEYQMEIVESDYAPSCDGLGMVLRCKAQVIGAEFDLRPYYLNFTLEHRDEARQERGQRDFAGLRRATGVLAPTDTQQLHFVPFRVFIGVQEDASRNIVKQYLFDDEALAA